MQQDPLGSVTAIVNPGGYVDERYRYDPYGNVTYMGYYVTGRSTSSSSSWVTLPDQSHSQFGMTYLFQGNQLSMVMRGGREMADTYITGSDLLNPGLRRLQSPDADPGANSGYEFDDDNPSGVLDNIGQIFGGNARAGLQGLAYRAQSLYSSVSKAVTNPQALWENTIAPAIVSAGQSFDNYCKNLGQEFSRDPIWALSNLSAGAGDTVSMGLTQKIRALLWGDTVSTDSAAYGTGVAAGTVVNIGLGFANPCGSSASAIRAINWIQAAGGSLNYASNMMEGNYLTAAMDALGVLGNLSQLSRACFEPETNAVCEDGWKEINAVVPLCDRVLSRNENDPYGSLEFKLVLQKFERWAYVLKLHLEEGQVLGTTAEHPFLKEGAGWVPCSELLPGDRIWTRECRWVRVEEVFDTQEIKRVINLQVEDFATFFVGGDDWGFSVWAHNAYNKVGGTGAAYDELGGQGVYVLRDASDNIRYVGRGDAPARLAAHATPGSGKEDLVGQILFNNNLSARRAISLEQELQQLLGGVRSTNPETPLRNLIQGLGERNPNFLRTEFAASDGLVIEALRRAKII